MCDDIGIGLQRNYSGRTDLEELLRQKQDYHVKAMKTHWAFNHCGGKRRKLDGVAGLGKLWLLNFNLIWF